jgi:apolipoprotein N-acyltransferase
MKYLLIMILLLAFYAFLIHRARMDNEMYPTNSSWWLMFLAVINFVWWLVIFCAVVAAKFGYGKYHANWYHRFIDYNLVDTI